MKIKTYKKVSLIKNCSQKELFDFHLDTNNLKLITPKDTKVELLTKNFIAKEGAILKIKTVKHFIPSTWEVKIKELKKPSLLVDVALKSPFTYWEHQHIFSQKGEDCLLEDIVYYALPFGKIGEFFDFFIQKELENMFSFRHKTTKEILEDL
ncbi:MAG: SRPBCC family protein [Arcobacter sp.]|nr:SRPBCC family protein [Arcobacter sp.]